MRTKEGSLRGASRCGRAIVLALLLVSVPPAVASSDSWITTRIKIALLTTEVVGGDEIDVDTVGGRAILHGTVKSSEERANAIEEAREIEGVKSVYDLLRVVPGRNEAGVKASDSELKRQVAEALREDRSLDDSSIVVESVHDGVVLLGGKAASAGDHLRAIQAVHVVAGLRRVETEVEAPGGLADEGLRRSADPPTGAAKDMWITADTKARLFADRRAPALDINVDTRAGVVTLFGSVSSKNARTVAAADAHEVRGVTRVVNDLQVARGKCDKVTARDEDLKIAVEQALARREGLEGIDVAVKHGLVRFTGTVEHEPQRLEAAIAARSISGVRAVEDDLRMTAAAPER
jgi:hyperosmotically inducible protein